MSSLEWSGCLQQYYNWTDGIIILLMHVEDKGLVVATLYLKNLMVLSHGRLKLILKQMQFYWKLQCLDWDISNCNEYAGSVDAAALKFDAVILPAL